MTNWDTFASKSLPGPSKARFSPPRTPAENWPFYRAKMTIWDTFGSKSVPGPSKGCLGQSLEAVQKPISSRNTVPELLQARIYSRNIVSKLSRGRFYSRNTVSETVRGWISSWK